MVGNVSGEVLRQRIIDGDADRRGVVPITARAFRILFLDHFGGKFSVTRVLGDLPFPMEGRDRRRGRIVDRDILAFDEATSCNVDLRGLPLTLDQPAVATLELGLRLKLVYLCGHWTSPARSNGTRNAKVRLVVAVVVDRSGAGCRPAARS